MQRLTNPVRAYAWGSRTHIPRMCGLAVSDDPVAEMWFGAHESDPSRDEHGVGLDELIERSPLEALGLRVVDSFGPRLPFLMKLLAASEPLSLQVHPASERARIRFAEQNAAAIPTSSPTRSYQDASHKPELIFALTRFEGMAGFRDAHRTAEIIRTLQIAWLNEIADEIDASATPFQTLREVTTRLLALRGEDLRNRLQVLRAAADRAEVSSHRPPTTRWRHDLDPATVERESIRVFAQTRSLVDLYPEDAGVFVTLLLNHVVLAAGEAMFVAPGMMHAYTSGFGVEIMAASDNVLRAGLTPKHVDIPELLEITNFTPTPPPRWAPVPLPDAEGVVFSPPVDEFELVVATLSGNEQFEDSARPMIVLCLDGVVTVSSHATALELARGQSLFVEERDGRATLAGEGRVAIGRTPR